MGFKKSWDEGEIIRQLRIMAGECMSPYNDGFTGLYIKQDLLLIKFLLDDLIEQCPKFSGEEEIYHAHLVDKLK
jgi:hypothetical protein